MGKVRVYLSLAPDQVTPETGIGRVVLAQHRYLPEYEIELVSDPERADVIACHVGRDERLPRVDVNHIHGLYFQDLPHEAYRNWHHGVNRGIIQSLREARAVTVPSDWVGECLRRDMRIRPHVIGHGIDLEEWQPGENLGYVLWNKGRSSDVCDPMPAWELARKGLPVITTFGPAGKSDPNMTVTGLLPASKMRVAVACADVYLGTTMETFGIGTLEALSCGVPVLGYRWGGTEFIVRHGVDGYLVEPGDIAGLLEGYWWIREHRKELSANARRRAAEFSWSSIIFQYAHLYRALSGEPRASGVAVVVPSYNYADYLPECIQSLQRQTRPIDEIVIVDDCSTDNTPAIAQALAETDPKIRYIRHPENQGVAAARNHGIEAVRSEFVVCLDADDRLAPDYVAVCAQALERDRSLGVAYTGLMLQGDGGQPIPSEWPPEFDWSIMTTVSVPPSNCIPSAAMFRRAMWERAGGYRQIYAPAEDTEFWVRGLACGFNARKVSVDGLFIYRVHAGSASRTKTYKAIDMWHPWMRDRQFPMAAPGVKRPAVSSYALPVISVVIPVGPGHEHYLTGAIDSLLGQTFRAWELIVVDDTRDDLLQPALRPYPFAKVYQNKGKPGASAARNLGISRARAPLLLFLDADDYLDPNALERMLAAFLDAGGRYIYTDWLAVPEEGAPALMQSAEYDPNIWLETLAGRSGGIHGVTILMATEDAREHKFDEDLYGWEEFDWFIHLATRGIHGRRLPEPLFYYRVSTGARRKISLDNQSDLTRMIQTRYRAYLKGEKIMPSCCGGSGSSALLAAKRMLQGMQPEPQTEFDPAAYGDQMVRMQFIGSEQGAVWYQGEENSGRKYQGADNPLHRYANVHPADVERMLRTNKWRVVERPVVPVAQASVPEPAPVVEPTAPVSASDLRRQAEASLIAAREAFARAEQDPAIAPAVESPGDPIAGFEARLVEQGEKAAEQAKATPEKTKAKKRPIVKYEDAPKPDGQ